MSPRTRRGRCHGGVLVEFVAVLPVLLLLVLAAIDWGWYFTLRESAIHATREGARVGSVAPDQTLAEQQAKVVVDTYMKNALGRAASADVSFDDRLGYTVISVRLINYPAASITGLADFTRVPQTISTRADMRLEVQ